MCVGVLVLPSIAGAGAGSGAGLVQTHTHASGFTVEAAQTHAASSSCLLLFNLQAALSAR